ncbi:ImmA/IrrE family metallo-endopeptidase [Anaerorhabdus sp.]|uniref:ImmA/IrrE family metallo-endopeptidase n=1 Tax=Anaerorhabdus sp. TaxID=1872524 RepID=UPI002B21B81E|nr:ImmA/IrrE family metallo-endopeptidase [Anaerorhabdus sp.]MEA4875295.1 ImmA/IrrE family metallo-endopeptidase [Anaerorhabdus sp.]
MDDLLKYADNNDYQVLFHKTNEIRSFSMELQQKLYINLDETQFESEIEKRVCLAHEIGHCISGTTYTLNHSKLYRGSAEYKADYRAAQLLVPIEKLKECISKGIIEKYIIAEFFGITEEFVDRVLYIYSNKGLLMDITQSV